MSDAPTASVVIATRNRCKELRIALHSALLQSSHPEVIVIDDGSDDGTAEMVRTAFPLVKLVCHDRPTGYIVARNEGAKIAQGSIIFSIDDDAAFSTTDVVSQTIQEFATDKIGAVAIPYIDVNRDGIERQRTPDSKCILVADRYIGTAHAIRRQIFLGIGGYREQFFHQGEESDFCIRMLDAGYFVRLGNSDRIDHFESPKRDTKRMDLYGRRNDILFVFLNVPLRYLPLHLLSLTIKGILFGVRVRRPFHMIRGLVMGYAAAIRYRRSRAPVSIATYKLYRRLRVSQAVPLEDCRQFLP